MNSGAPGEWAAVVHPQCCLPEDGNDQRIPRYIGGDSLDSISTIADCDASLEADLPCSSDQSGCWEWKINSIPQAPQGMPLERTAQRLRDIPLQILSSRLCCYMRNHSIQCSCHTEEGRVDCLTNYRLRFVVQLWQGEADDDIVMEVQRRRGCGIAMHWLRKSLIRSVVSPTSEMVVPPPYPPMKKPSPILSKRICARLKHMDQEHSKFFRVDVRGQCLDFLESQSVDENRLGMDMLVVLTDAKKSDSQKAEELARAFIYNEGCQAERLREAYIAFFTRVNEEGDWTVRTDDASVTACPKDCDLDDTFSLSLNVLVNCLESIVSNEQDYLLNECRLLHLESPFWDEILNMLVCNIREASFRPQEAALSTKSLRILMLLEPEVVSPFLDTVVAPLLSEAYDFGKARHMSLEAEASELMKLVRDGPDQAAS